MNGELNAKAEEDVLYQKGASFSAKLDNSHSNNNNLDDGSENVSDDSGESDSDETFLDDMKIGSHDGLHLITDTLKLAAKVAGAYKPNRTAIMATTSRPIAETQNAAKQIVQNYYSSKEDVFDDPHRNRANSRITKPVYHLANNNWNTSPDTDEYVGAMAKTAPVTGGKAVQTKTTTNQPETTSKSYIHIDVYKGDGILFDGPADDTTKAPETIITTKDDSFQAESARATDGTDKAIK